MSGYQIALRLACGALALLTLVGLWKRDRLRRLWLLGAHLVGTSVALALELIQPRLFFVWHVWAVRELILLALVLGIVAEVAWRAFAPLPEERRQARLVLALALLIPLVLVALTPWHQGDLADASWPYVLILDVLPRLAYGAGFVCLALVWAMARRLVPSDPLHASVLLGLAAYLFVYSFALGRAGQGGPQVLLYVVTPLAYVLLLAFWAWIAWREERAPEAPLEVQRKLQPWRH